MLGEPSIRTPTTSAFEDFNRPDLWERSTQEPPTEPELPTPETTTTQGSYETVPEITEKVERLFEHIILNQPTERTEPQEKGKLKEIEIDINTMTGGDTNTDTNMLDGTPRPTELKLSPPKSFTGKRDELDGFLQDVHLYLEVNSEIYDTDKKKIAYALSFMNEGDAKSWKGQFITEKTTPTGLNLGTWTEFTTSLTTAFAPFDAPGDALERLTSLKMGNNSIEDHIAQYKVLLSKSKVPDDSPSAIDYFRRTLNVPLQRKLLELPTQPKDLKEWYEWASRLDNNYRRMQRILGRPAGKGREEPTRRWTFQKKEKDPNAMDVDALTIDKRTEYMKKGLCFGCGKGGHLNRDCPDRKKPTVYKATTSAPPSYSPPKKMAAKELYTHIRSLTALMNEEEKEEFYQEAEKEGF